MHKNIKLAVIGGDRRQISLARFLRAQRYDVHVFGLGEVSVGQDITVSKTLNDAVFGAAAVILPLPASSDGVRINCPALAEGESPKLQALLNQIEKDTYIIGGRFSSVQRSAMQERNIKYYDYFESEELQLRNALPTAEGAISIAMQELDITLYGARAAVVGYGRIEKLLAAMLRALGADVTVAARKSTVLVEAEHSGCKTLKIEYKNKISSIEKLCHGYDVIFNTVPYWLFDDSVLSKLDKSTFIVDLASAPGGVDIRSAKENGIKVNWALSLPGKYAPITAGEIIGKSVCEFLESEGARA